MLETTPNNNFTIEALFQLVVSHHTSIHWDYLFDLGFLLCGPGQTFDDDLFRNW
jgi:hypothetical protein